MDLGLYDEGDLSFSSKKGMDFYSNGFSSSQSYLSSKTYSENSNIKKKYKISNSKNIINSNVSFTKQNELIEFLLKDRIELEKKVELLNEKVEKLLKLQKEKVPKGFFTVSEPISELWDNEMDDEWDKL